jgi:hypothetical protein
MMIDRYYHTTEHNDYLSHIPKGYFALVQRDYGILLSECLFYEVGKAKKGAVEVHITDSDGVKHYRHLLLGSYCSRARKDFKSDSRVNRRLYRTIQYMGERCGKAFLSTGLTYFSYHVKYSPIPFEKLNDLFRCGFYSVIEPTFNFTWGEEWLGDGKVCHFVHHVGQCTPDNREARRILCDELFKQSMLRYQTRLKPDLRPEN